MSRALNGLHWQSPVTSDSAGSRSQVNGAGSGVGFGSVLILSHTDVPPAGEQASKDSIYWLEYNMSCRAAGVPFYEAVIARLYYPKTLSLPSASTLASQWGNFIRWCQGQGVYNFQVLNEIDAEHNGTATPQFMSDLGYRIMNVEKDARFPLWLGFPGPSANTYPGSSAWNDYWNNYAGGISSYYGNLALHAYPARIPGLDGLKEHAWLQAQDIRSRFPDRPQRFTEYGIPLDHEGGNRTNRANDYKAFVNWVRSGWNNYILACHVYIGRDTPGENVSPTYYELTDGEVQNLTSGVGCVGF